MNPGSIFFFVMIALCGSVIALQADRWGRALGKKRLSLLGMRPKRTAEAFILVGGALVPILAVVFVSAFSAGVREWIINGPRILQQRDDARQGLHQTQVELKNKADQLIDVRAQVDKWQAEATKLRAAAQPLQTQVATLEKRASADKEQLDSMQNTLASEKQQLQMAISQRDGVKSELAADQREVTSDRKEVADLRRTKDDLDKTVASQKANYAILQTSYRTAELNLQAEKKKLDDALAQETVAKSDLTDTQSKLTQARSQLVAIQSQLDEANSQLDAKKEELASSEAELTKTQITVGQYSELFDESRMMPVIFNRGDELARIPVPPRITKQQAEETIDQLVSMASLAASERGAQKHTHEHECGLIDLPLGKNHARISADQLKEGAERAIADSSEPLIIVARAYYNTVEGEFVPLVFDVYRNPLIYKKNQTIAETFVPGSLSDQQIFEQIASFLNQKVESRAKQDKMIPMTGRDESFGEISPGDVVALVEKIHGWGNSVRLVAEARQDTHAGDRLAIKFNLLQ